MDLIQENPVHENTFEKCKTKLFKMKETIFYFPYSYYLFSTGISRSIRKLSVRTKNEGFVKKFQEKLDMFSYYENDLRIIFNEAVQVKDKREAVVLRLYLVFEDFLPAVVLRYLAENLTLEDLPL